MLYVFPKTAMSRNAFSTGQRDERKRKRMHARLPTLWALFEVIVIICAAGDIHGGLDRMYEQVLAFETSLGVHFAWLLHVGDFGIWSDPARIDGATRRHDGAGDFPVWLAERRNAPRPTVFIKGNHEDFVSLDTQPSTEVLPGLHYLKNGHVFELVDGGETLLVGGVGGCYGPSDFERGSSTLQGYAKRHYTHDEITTLCLHSGLDIVLTHDAPAGVRFTRHRRGEGYISEAAGLDELLARTQPRVCFFGHHHTRFDAEVANVPCLGLNKGPHPGCLVAIEMKPGGRTWQLLGEWPAKGPHT
jgi:Icc-related predicted phosphoesterase